MIRQEDSIIYSLVERAQYRYNSDTYDPNAFLKDEFQGCLVEFIVRETEKLHAQVRHWSSHKFKFLQEEKNLMSHKFVWLNFGTGW